VMVEKNEAADGAASINFRVSREPVGFGPEVWSNSIKA
jgi:hypothetical protein